MIRRFFRDRINGFIQQEFDRATELYLSKLTTGTILQVGANDGVAIDPVRKFAVLPKFTSYLLEPVPYIFERLQKNYHAYPQVKLFQQAITDTGATEQAFYYVKAENDSDMYKSLFGSFSKEHVEHFFNNDKDGNVEIVEEAVSCATLDVFIQAVGIKHIDYLQIDAEGYDLAILKTLNFERIRPDILRFEHVYADKIELAAFLRFLKEGYKYRCYSHGYDTICFSTKGKTADTRLSIIKKLRSSVFENEAG